MSPSLGLPAPAPCARRALLRVRDDDRGAGYLAAFIVLFSILTVVGVGILVDSSRYFTTYRQTGSMAMEAARAGANALDGEALGTGEIIVDPLSAQFAAEEAVSGFVAGSGATIDFVTVSDDRVSVRVSAAVDSWFPFMPNRTVAQEATAVATRGEE